MARYSDSVLSSSSKPLTANPMNLAPSISETDARIFEITSFDEENLPESNIELVAKWFLNKSSMSNKKLQKLCYYAHCWFIVFFNDIEAVTSKNSDCIQVLDKEQFQAWIHGPVCPKLYRKYKDYGWHDIPKVCNAPQFSQDIDLLLQQVWEAYGDFSADELESISHEEFPWINARRGVQNHEACTNKISNYDILQYYSSLGE